MTEPVANAGAAPANRSNDDENTSTSAAQAMDAAAGADDPQVKHAELTAQNTELKDRHVRLQAEFENFRKRKMREGDEIRAYAAASLITDVLPVLDHLELALDAAHDRTDPGWGKGIDLIARQLAEALRSNGLEEVTAATGDKFDPAWHEAVAEETTDGLPAGSIVRILRKGFRLRERLLRAAQVVVAREDDAATSASSPER